MKTSAQKIFLFGVMILITLAFGRYSGVEVYSQTPDKEEKIKLTPANLEEAVLEAVQAIKEEKAEPVEEKSDAASNILKGESEQALEVLQEEVLAPKEESARLPSFSASVVSVSNLKTRDVYFEYEASRRWPMASITKLMTAVVAFRKIDQAAIIEISDKDFAFLDGTVFKLKPGEKYSRDDLLDMTLGVSSNEAAEALANFYGRERFVEEMNLQAKEWGLNNTFYKDPTGISVSNQSTAGDLRESAIRIYNEEPTVFEITRRAKIDIREQGSKKIFRFDNINTFTSRKDFLGGKTGYTEEAQQNLLSIFKYDGQLILIVVLGTEDRFAQTEGLFDWYKNIRPK